MSPKNGAEPTEQQQRSDEQQRTSSVPWWRACASVLDARVPSLRCAQSSRNHRRKHARAAAAASRRCRVFLEYNIHRTRWRLEISVRVVVLRSRSSRSVIALFLLFATLASRLPHQPRPKIVPTHRARLRSRIPFSAIHSRTRKSYTTQY